VEYCVFRGFCKIVVVDCGVFVVGLW
jgi:hypothetical protein